MLNTEILNSKSKVRLPFKGESLKDALNFGFSYLEYEDHMVHFIMAGPTMMKRIFAEISDAVFDLDHEKVGQLWTAELLYSKKLKDNELVFSNEVFSAVIDVNLNPNLNEE
jgi:hypothetical protein